MESTAIGLYELEIPLFNVSTPQSFTVNVLEISHESWENKIGCEDGKNKDVYIEGRYFIDSSDNVSVMGNSEALINCTLLSVTENEDKSQNGFVGVFSNSMKWESKGLFISSKSERESQIFVDKHLNIETWVTEDSWTRLDWL